MRESSETQMCVAEKAEDISFFSLEMLDRQMTAEAVGNTKLSTEEKEFGFGDFLLKKAEQSQEDF